MMSMDRPQHRIYEARRRAGLSQAALADRLGWDRAWISRLENQVAEPRLTTLRQLARALNVSVFDLLPEGDGIVT